MLLTLPRVGSPQPRPSGTSMGTGQVWGPVRTKPFPIEPQTFNICKSTQIPSLHPPKLDHHQQTGENNVCHRFHSRHGVLELFASPQGRKVLLFLEMPLHKEQSPHPSPSFAFPPSSYLECNVHPGTHCHPANRREADRKTSYEIKLRQSGTL